MYQVVVLYTDPDFVSMKSGLEGRNNQSYIDNGIAALKKSQ